MKQKILTVPNPTLRQKAKKVSKIDKKTLSVIRDLKDTLESEKNPRGAGLSAPQIGKSVRICLIYARGTKELIILINPEVVWRSKATTDKKNPYYEGCLSVPGIWGVVKRPKTISVRYLTPDNQVVTRKFAGLTSTVVQHEIDHLDGILFVDRILAQKGKLYQVEKDKEGKEELVEVKLDLV